MLARSIPRHSDNYSKRRLQFLSSIVNTTTAASAPELENKLSRSSIVLHLFFDAYDALESIRIGHMESVLDSAIQSISTLVKTVSPNYSSVSIFLLTPYVSIFLFTPDREATL